MSGHHEARVAAIRQLFPPGQRVRFVAFGEAEPADLPVDTRGTVQLVDDAGTVHIEWDNGVRLGCVLLVKPGRQPDRITRA